MGRTHALSGAVAYAVVAPLLHATPVQVAVGAACTAGAALLPDLDHPKASATRALGPVTMAVGWVVRRLSGGHRHGSHSLIGIGVFAAVGWACSFGTYASMAALWVLASLAVRAFRRRDPAAERALAAVVMAAGAWCLTTNYDLHPWFLPLSIALGAAAHLLGDAMTEQGLRPLWLGLALLLWRATGADVIHALNPITLTGGTR